MTSGARILELLALLQNHRYWSGDELARRLDVSPRTLRRTVERLRELGYPVTATPGVGGGYQLSAGGSLPPLVVDDEEAVAIVLGLRAATHSGVGGVADAAVRALVKVVGVLPGRLRRTADDLGAAIPVPGRPTGPHREVDLGTLTDIAGACRDRQQIAFHYEDRRGERTAREVEPHALVPYEEHWYVVAHDLHAHDWRTFRLDRISDVEPRRRAFLPRAIPDDDPIAFVASSFASGTARYAVDVTVEAPADRVRAEVAHWGQVEELTATTSRLTMRVDTLDWVAFMLGSLDAPFTVHNPPELNDYLLRWARRFNSATASNWSV